jgi:hypothetical protein
LSLLSRNLSVVQERLERFYQLEGGHPVEDFVIYANGVRETTLVHTTSDGIELAVVLPRTLQSRAKSTPDEMLQAVEGVSHFVFLVERARRDLPTTHLELELQAEVDKFVLLALADAPQWFRRTENRRARARRVHHVLYARMRHLHPPGTEIGDRYRLASTLAARMTRRVIERDDPSYALDFLRRFYRAGQAEKIRVATSP